LSLRENSSIGSREEDAVDDDADTIIKDVLAEFKVATNKLAIEHRWSVSHWIIDCQVLLAAVSTSITFQILLLSVLNLPRKCCVRWYTIFTWFQTKSVMKYRRRLKCCPTPIPTFLKNCVTDTRQCPWN
jgi:hypothetical protein